MNRLQFEKSPYLRQHMHNPVDWHPWGPGTLQLAREQGKPLLISIGYATCHWCHVMEKECFEDTEVAQLMNAHFVNVKVDREERPEVDDYYMDAVHLMGQGGGWPLNCVAMPDGRPIWGGTYLPKARWMDVLSQLVDLFLLKPENAEQYASEMHQTIARINQGVSTGSHSQVPNPASETIWVKQLMQSADRQSGGFGHAPKFPMPHLYQFLIRYLLHEAQDTVQEHLALSLDQMAAGGLHDVVGGGFSRYSTDGDWWVPHFEKMLYDNAQLLSLYSEGYALGRNPWYRLVAERIVGFLERELLGADGAFHSALDADSEGEEGRYYVWTYQDVVGKVGHLGANWAQILQLSKQGNWEQGKNIPRVDRTALRDNARNENDLLQVFEVLLKARNQRTRPLLDDKVITSWNALAVIGLIDAANYLNEPRYALLAANTLAHIAARLHHAPIGLLRLNHQNDSAWIPAYLEDYAYYIAALIKAFEHHQNRDYLLLARELLDTALQVFPMEGGPLLLASQAGTDIPVRKLHVHDNVMPSANAVMAENLFLLGHYFSQPAYMSRSQDMLQAAVGAYPGELSFFSYWARVHHLWSHPFFELVLTGPQAQDMAREIRSWLLPNKILVIAQDHDTLALTIGKAHATENRIYPCEFGVCHRALGSTQGLRAFIKEQGFRG
ncbi:MAG: thioredoxin domain-containing protein [Bacteroidetes bacterium]|nr:thioredoxin domain-containing protein [Bacteroidota bacterium]